MGQRELGWTLFLPVLKTILSKFKTILPVLKPILSVLKSILPKFKTFLLLKLKPILPKFKPILLLKPVILADLERTRLTDLVVQHRERVQ